MQFTKNIVKFNQNCPSSSLVDRYEKMCKYLYSIYDDEITIGSDDDNQTFIGTSDVFK